MKFKDYYETLGVARDASEDEIKRAYRRLARKYHPDVSDEADAEARFKEMKEAYEVLKDPEKRSAYDQFGEHWEAGQDFQPPPGWQPNMGSGAFGGAEQFSDFFDALFGRGRAGAFHAGRSPNGFHGGRMQGEDINASITIPIEDAFAGATRQITLDVPVVDAGGRVSAQRRTLNVKLPKGVMAGQRIRLEGQGGPGFGEGVAAGDLYLRVEYQPHPFFEVRDRDVYLTLPVTAAEAALGRTVKAPTLGGAVDLKLPAGSSTGKRLRLKGRGLPGKPPGDQYVELRVVVPSNPSAKARELYQALEREERDNPRRALGV